MKYLSAEHATEKGHFNSFNSTLRAVWNPWEARGTIRLDFGEKMRVKIINSGIMAISTRKISHKAEGLPVFIRSVSAPHLWMAASSSRKGTRTVFSINSVYSLVNCIFRQQLILCNKHLLWFLVRYEEFYNCFYKLLINLSHRMFHLSI